MGSILDVDGYFKFELTPDGVFIIVYPPIGKGDKVSFEEVEVYIEERKWENIDKVALKEAITSPSGVPVKIAPPQKEEGSLQQLLLVEQSNDGMRAYLTILLPPTGGRIVKVEEIIEELHKKGIHYGIKEEVIEEMLREEKFNEITLIAEGIPPQDGRDAYFEFTIELPQEREDKFPLLPDGRVDFKNLRLIPCVNKGEVILVKKRATQGTPGIKVSGETIPPKPGKDIPLPVGKNVIPSEDGLSLIATAAGQVIPDLPSRVDIEPTYVVHGDVNYSTGNIDFTGSVLIEGDVCDGFAVKAGGNIEIRGGVGKVEIESGGDIIIAGGINGKGEAKVKAKGNLITRFIEYAYVEAGKDVIVNEAILHSEVNAERNVAVLQGKRGTILGGKVRAGEEINAKIIGSPYELATELDVGLSPFLRQEIEILTERLKKDKRNFSQLKLGIKTLIQQKQKAKDNKLPPYKEELLNNYLKAQNLLAERLNAASDRIIELQREFASNTTGKIKVSNIIYPGVRLAIRSVSFLVEEEYKFVTFYLRAGKIEVKPYEEAKSSIAA